MKILKDDDIGAFHAIVEKARFLYRKDKFLTEVAFVLKDKEFLVMPNVFGSKEEFVAAVRGLAKPIKASVIWVNEGWMVKNVEGGSEDFKKLVSGEKQVRDCSNKVDCITVTLTAPEGGMMYVAEVKDGEILKEEMFTTEKKGQHLAGGMMIYS